MTSHRAHRLSLYAAVGLAAALGGSLRYAVSVAWLQGFGDSVAAVAWPWPTLLVNVAGSLLIAAYWRLAGPGGRWQASMERRAVVMTGFCGGLTTFSMFGVETLQLIENARWIGAAAYVLLTGGVALGAAGLALLGHPRSTLGTE